MGFLGLDKFFSPIVDVIGDFAKNAGKDLKDVVTNVGDGLTSVREGLKQAGEWYINRVDTVANTIHDDMRDLFGGVKEVVIHGQDQIPLAVGLGGAGLGLAGPLGIGLLAVGTIIALKFL